MKNNFFGTLVLILTVYQYGYTATNVSTHERPIIGVQAGLNFETASAPSQVSSSSRTGFTVGAALELPINTGISIQPELNYSRRSMNLSNAAGIEANVYYHSLELPVLFKASIGEGIRPYIFAGPMGTWNFSKEIEVADQNSSASYAFNPKTIDVAAVVGAGLQINSFFINGRYSAGLLEINESSAEWRSRGIKLLAGLQF